MGLNKSIGDEQRLMSEITAAQISEQKIIGEFAVRLRAIEQKLES
jgi:hypothetical protein